MLKPDFGARTVQPNLIAFKLRFDMIEFLFCPIHGLLRPDNLVTIWGFGSQGFGMVFIWLKIKLDKLKKIWYN